MPSWLILAQEGGGGGGFTGGFLWLFVAWFFIIWLFVLRPQKRAEAKRRSELGALQKNDVVVTQGGVIGTVVDLKDDVVTLRVDEKTGARLRVTRKAVAGLYQAEAEDDGPETKK